MYDFMYADNETIPQDEKLPDTRSFVENHKKKKNPGLVTKH